MPPHPEYVVALLSGCLVYFLSVYGVFRAPAFELKALVAGLGIAVSGAPLPFLQPTSLKTIYMFGLGVGFIRVIQYKDYRKAQLMKEVSLKPENLQKIESLETDVKFAQAMAIAVIVETIYLVA